MKKSAAVISVIATSILFPAIVILAAEPCPVSFGEYDKLVQSNFQNQCLLVAKYCATENDTVQQRVNELRVEIAKGPYVYTPQELRALKEQLKWIESDGGNQFI